MLQINTEDIRLVTQPIVDTRVKIDVYDERNMNHLEQWECGIISATFSISSESDIRRTASLTVTPEKNKRIRLKKDSIIWINRVIQLQIGIQSMRTGEYKYFKCGWYVFQNYGAVFDTTNNTITLSLQDFWCNLDGSRNGQVGGASTISYPAYVEDSVTGEVIKYNKIRDVIITILLQLGKLKESQLQIDNVGEYKGMEDYNPDYLQYREESKVETQSGLIAIWDALPYDQEFSCGDTVASMLTTLRDLYPNYEMYFDVENNFVCNLIPSCYEDDIILNSDFFDRIYISENTSIDLTTVKNVCEVWGQSIETDYYTEKCTYANNCYSATVETYDKYVNADCIAIKIPTANQTSCSININNLGEITIYDENTDKPIKENVMDANQVYVFKVKSKYMDGSSTTRAYLLGQYQPHSLCVLTDGTTSIEDYIAQDGSIMKKYSKEYFQKLFNCKTVVFKTVKDSPFTIQEVGQLLKVCTGGEFDNITSDSLASARADYEVYKGARLTDNISITTKLVPFADVNIKVSYRRKDTGEINQYIVKNISHDLSSGGATTWQLMRFYPLYQSVADVQSWEDLSAYTWEEASEYTWEDIM